MSTLRRFRAAVLYGLARLQGEHGRYDRLPEALAFARLSEADVHAEQVRRLRALLLHAGATVPYWRAVFAETRFEPRDVSAVADLAVLPPLTRDLVRREGDRLISDRYDKRRLLRRQTGGSTSEPMVFYASRDDYEAQLSLHLRSMAQVGVWPGDGEAKLWGYNQPRQLGNLLAPLTGRLFFDAVHASPAAMDGWIRKLQAIRPATIYGYAGALHQLAEHVATRGARLPGLRCVFSTAEKLFPEQRVRIEAGLGVRVYDLYGSHEVPRLAAECHEGRMHLYPDAAVTEFVPTGPDTPPRMLLTALHAWAMPLIRYDQGDTVVPVAGDCPCRLPFPQISMEVGKVHHLFALPSGERVHTTYFSKALYPIEAVQQFQIQHRALDDVRILAVPQAGRAAEAEAALAATCTRLAARFEGTVAVKHELVAVIPKTPRGKQPVVTSDVPADTTWEAT